MRVVTRYLLREFSKMAAAAVAGFLALFVVIDFFERADEFLKYKPPRGRCSGITCTAYRTSSS